MATKGKATVKRPAKKNGYQMPEPLKAGDVLKDTQKGQWKVGVSIGVGGFGEIYSACDAASSIKKVDDYPFVVKIVSCRQNPTSRIEFHNIYQLSRSRKGMVRCSWKCTSTFGAPSRRTSSSSRRVAV